MPDSWRRCLITVALIGSGSIFTVAFAGTAQAEQCASAHRFLSSELGNPPVNVCLLADASQPLLPPTTLSVRVPSEATDVGVSAGFRSYLTTLAQAGGPGGTSLWVSSPLEAQRQDDQQFRVDVRLSMPCTNSGGDPCTDDYEANFVVPVLSPSGANRMTFSATKKRVTMTYRFEARKPLLVVPQLVLNAFPKGRVIIVTLRSKKKVFTDLGPHTISVSLSRRTIRRKCQDYGGCFVLGWGRSWLSEPGLPERAQEADSGTYSPRKRVYRKQ